MYCKKCHKFINKNTINCPYCGFNNSNDFEMGKTTELDLSAINSTPYISREEKKKNKIMIAIIGILVISTVMIFRFNSLTSKGDTSNYTTTTTKETIVNKKYIFGDFNLYYDNGFILKDNTLVNKENNNYTITFNIIDNDKYYEISNDNELLDTQLNEIECRTYASDNKYGYLIDYNNNKYHIEVNYLEEENETIQSSIAKVLKSIEIK